MKKLFTFLIATGIVTSSAWAQSYFDIPLTNPDLEADVPFEENAEGNQWTGEGWVIWAFPGGNPEYVGELSGLAPGEGVNGSQAVRVQQLKGGAGDWHTIFKSEFIDIRPTGAGSYVISFSIKSDSVITQEKVGDEHFMWCTFAMKDKDGGPLGGKAFGPIVPWEDQFILHEGYIEVSDTIDIPETATHNNTGNTGEVAYLEFNIQLAKHSGSYLFDNFSLKGPESFYDLTFEVHGIVDGDTTALEGAEVLFDGLDYATDIDGMASVTDLKEGTYEWSVAANGFEPQSGSKAVNQFETVSIFLEEAVILSNSSDISARMHPKIYPNPANQSVQIISEKSTIQRVELHTLSGKVLISATPNSSDFTLDISTYPNGIYLIRAVNQDDKVSTKRLVIAH